MTLIEDPSVFLADFGVPVTAGAVTGVGILDMPGNLTADGMAISTDYLLRCETSRFGNLLYGDEVTAGGVVYQVRETRLIDDGTFVEVTLMRLDPGTSALGRDPRQGLMLDDLVDVSITNPSPGEVLTTDGEHWSNAADVDKGVSLVDAISTANTIYVGIAAKGAAQSSAVWTITRSVFSAAGIRTSKGTATGVTWTGRTTHTYA